MSRLTGIDSILLDIEGTTTSISFVYDELFPYIRGSLDAFLEGAWGDAALQSDVVELRRQAAEDVRQEVPGATLLPPDGGDADVLRHAVSRNVGWLMDSDRKTTGLKALQGKIWVDGYRSGQLKGHLFPEVPGVLRRLKAEGHRLFIYSSGSIAAQKLLFGHSIAGDLCPLFSGHFDTTSGSKKESSSYLTIARSLERAPDRILFLTDHLDEARAAREAGLKVVVSLRLGNAPLPAHDFESITSFERLFEADHA
jgi:enolase-phosphatase E1